MAVQIGSRSKLTGLIVNSGVARDYMQGMADPSAGNTRVEAPSGEVSGEGCPPQLTRSSGAS